MEKKQDLLLGVDVGTHKTKGILIDESYRPVAEFSMSHTIENPKPGYYEMDADIWWAEFCTIAKELLKIASADPGQVKGIGVSVMGCDCIPVDSECNPLRKAILYGIDARSDPQIKRMLQELGEEKVIEMFGHIPHSDDVATKILWIKEEEPDVYGRTFKFLTGSSFMAAKLTGQYTIDTYLAKVGFRPVYTEDAEYDHVYGPIFCREDQMAEPKPVQSLAGTVTKKAAAECGLLEGTPVIVGTGDSTAESIAGGLLTPGTLFVQLGSTIFYIYCVDREMDYCREDQFPGSRPFTLPESYAVMGGTNCAGALTAWVKDNFYFPAGKTGDEIYKSMEKDALDVIPGSKGLIILPYLYGERSPIHDPKARGVIFGLTGEHSRKEIYRASLEGVAYSLGSHVKLFKKHGLDPDEVNIAGGGTLNDVWMKIMADVIGKPVSVAEEWQTASYGDACMAAIGCGKIKSFTELKKVIPQGRRVDPNLENTKVYRKYQEIYEALYKNTADLMHMLP